MTTAPHSKARRLLALTCAALLAVSLGACSTTTGATTPSGGFVPRATVAPLASPKYAAIVVDAVSGKVIWGQNETAQRYPASLTKMMTLYMLFEQMQGGRVSTSTVIPVSAYAAGRPPTKIGFRAGEGIDVDSAIKALITRSANDVAVAVGEYLGGTEEQFAAMMTQRARQIGMRDTTFRNASGLPDSGQVTTARDMATLSIQLRRKFPQYYNYFGVTEFGYRGKQIRGHNRLVEDVYGVDGIKTGYVRASGYNVATSVGRNGKRLVVVVMGADSGKQRNAHVAQIIASFLPSPYDRPADLPGALAVLDPTALPGVETE